MAYTLKKIIGFILLFVTVGILSLSSIFHLLPPLV